MVIAVLRGLLKEVPTEVYPKIERIFLDLLTHSGYPNVKFETKVDFKHLLILSKSFFEKLGSCNGLILFL